MGEMRHWETNPDSLNSVNSRKDFRLVTTFPDHRSNRSASTSARLMNLHGNGNAEAEK